MAFTLRVEFSGPCVYVPSAAGDQFDELTVLMVDARQPDPGSRQRVHVPVLLFDLADLRPSTSSSFMPLEDGRRGVVFLDREEILLAGASDQPPLRVFNSDSLPGSTSAERFGFNWMPRLDEALSGAGDLVPETLGAPSPPPAVAARIRLSRGDLFTAHMSTEGESYVRWTFKPADQEVAGGEPARQIGLDVGLELAVADEASVILGRFDTQQRRVLCFAPAGDDARVTLRFANREPSMIFSDDGVPEVHDTDPDFAYLYRLSAAPAVAAIAATARPIPQVAIGGATLGGITCGGGISNPGGGG